MKKSIDVINTEPSLLKYLSNVLSNNKEEYLSKDDLEMAFNNLADGISESLIIETKENNERNIISNVIECKDLKIYINSRRVTRNDVDIFLTPKEFDILYFLAKNRGEVFTKEQIYNAVWNENYLLDDSNIMAFIRKIRKKIEPNPDAPIYLITIWGIGYKFNDRL